MQKTGILRTWLSIVGLLAIALGPFGWLTPASPALADNTPPPASVTLVGNLQSELGCGGDWDPACASTYLTYDAADDVWQGVWSVPAGSWEYKAALNNSWDENYGLGGQPGGANIPLTLGAPTSVKFYYDHKTHWITDNQGWRIATAPGSYQSEIGCPGDWQPDCLRSWLQDPDGDGRYTFATEAMAYTPFPRLPFRPAVMYLKSPLTKAGARTMAQAGRGMAPISPSRLWTAGRP